jgi:hypothetical protein
MSKHSKRGSGLILILAPLLVLVALAATNPTEEHFRDVMRGQKSLTLDVASLLPIKRTNYVVASRFDIQYGIGTTTCWGLAAYVFLCPQEEAGKS